MNYLALGDSYTIGEAVEENERFPMQLREILIEKGIRVEKPMIIATTGWTTDELKAGIEQAAIKGQTFDMVSLLIGVNNQYRGRDIDNYRQEFVDLLNDAIQFADNKPENVIVVSIPDWGITPFGKASEQENISEKIDNFNAVKKQETDKQKVLFVDITPISRMAEIDNTLNASDELHPSGKMYKLWAEEIAKHIKFLSKVK